MDHLARGIYFKGQKLATTKPSPNIPHGLNYDALMALPFIGLRVGIDEMTPTKAVYAIYDGELDSLRFVHGDGSIIIPSQVCFLKEFKSGTSNNSQLLYSSELKKRSAKHFEQLTSNKDDAIRYTARVRNKFPTKSSVTASLTFVSDLELDSCPALTLLPPDYLTQWDNNKPTLCISLIHSPKYDFSTQGFQGRISPAYEVRFRALHINFKHRYESRISYLDFQHAAFCLKGLKEDLVHFLQEGRNDPKYFIDGLTPPLAPRPCVPLETTTGWTVDCFIARFRFYEKVYNEGEYQRLPNPIAWLEAELEEEKRCEGKDIVGLGRPWKGHVDGKKCEAVVDWDTLAGYDFWAVGGAQYPRLVSSLGPQPLALGDIINPKTGKFKESKKAKKESKEKERAEAKTRTANVEVMDLTGDDDFDSMLVGHMNRPYTQLPVRTPTRARSENGTEVRNAGSGFTPINSKRKHDDEQSRHLHAPPSIFGPKLSSQKPNSDTDVPEYDADSEHPWAATKRMSKQYKAKIHELSKGIKKEPSELLFDGADADIYSSGREPPQLYTTPTKKRLCRRNGSSISKPLDFEDQLHQTVQKSRQAAFEQNDLFQRNGSPVANNLEVDLFLSQDIKMEEGEPDSAAEFETSAHHHEDQEYFATAHEADSESDDEIMHTANSVPQTPSPVSKTPNKPHATQRFLEMFNATPHIPKPKKSSGPQNDDSMNTANSMPRTPTPGLKRSERFLEMFAAKRRSPEGKKFVEACDAFESTHKSPPNTPVTKHRFEPPAIKEEETSMRVQPPFGGKTEIEADGFVDVAGAPLEHPGGAEVKMEGSWLGSFLGR